MSTEVSDSAFLDAILTFTTAAERVGVKLFELAPIMGIHRSSLYRVAACGTRTSQHVIQSLKMMTKFLRWYGQGGRLAAPTLQEAFEIWLRE